MVESISVFLQKIRDKNLPANPGDVPAEVRLFAILPEIEKIAERSAQVRDFRAYAEAETKLALRYIPKLVFDVVTGLSETVALLTQHGVVHEAAKFENYDPSQAIKQVEAEVSKIVDNPYPGIYSKYKGDKGQGTTDLLREISQVVHPEGNLGRSRKSGTDDRKYALALAEAKRAAKNEDMEAANLALLGIKPAFYLSEIQAKLQQGKTLADIVAEDPTLVPELERLQYIAFGFLPERSTLSSMNFSSREAVDRETERMRRKKDIGGRGYAMVSIHQVVEEIGKAVIGDKTDHTRQDTLDRLTAQTEYLAGWIGGGCQFQIQHGDHIVTPWAKGIGEHMEEVLKSLPKEVHLLALVSLEEGYTAEDFTQASTALAEKLSVLRNYSDRYNQELQDEVNRPRQIPNLKGFIGSSSNSYDSKRNDIFGGFKKDFYKNKY